MKNDGGSLHEVHECTDMEHDEESQCSLVDILSELGVINTSKLLDEARSFNYHNHNSSLYNYPVSQIFRLLFGHQISTSMGSRLSCV